MLNWIKRRVRSHYASEVAVIDRQLEALILERADLMNAARATRQAGLAALEEEYDAEFARINRAYRIRQAELQGMRAELMGRINK